VQAGRQALFAAVLCVAAVVGLTTAGPANAATFVVKNTNDSGTDSLRAAITAANATPDLDTIKFNIPGAGTHTIVLASPLPAITQPVTINAQSQPGFVDRPLVELAAAGAVPPIGLDVQAGGSKVLGLSVFGFSQTAIRLAGGDGDTVSGCWVGVKADGTKGGNFNGITIEAGSGDDVIGGTSAGARNVISGNDNFGILIENDAAAGNAIKGNYVGTDPTGRAAIANSVGIRLEGTPNHTIGGTSAGGRNVVSGNVVGIELLFFGASGNVVQGNYVGVTASGKGRLANSTGIDVEGASGNTIGGTVGGAGNVVSGNGTGIKLAESGTSGNVVAGNLIGTDATGTGRIGNGQAGILINRGGANTVGGLTAQARNVISGQRAGAGIRILDSDGILVEGNYIGVDQSGDNILPNFVGVEVATGSSGTTIGGTAVGAGNVISGNYTSGVHLMSGATGTKIQGNLIGPAATGAPIFGNGTNVLVEGASDNSIGGAMAAAANTLAGSVGFGVAVDGTSGPANGNEIIRNSIFLNGGSGIALLSGANHSQHAPVVGPVTTTASGTSIAVQLDAAASTPFRVDVYTSPLCEPGGVAEARTLVTGGRKLVTDAAGHGSATYVVAALPAEESVTAIATNTTTHDTSTISQCVATP